MKYFYSILGALVLCISFISIAHTFAQTDPASLTYPIPELGGCTDQASCKMYCDEGSHIDVCLAYAETHRLLSDKELRDAKEFQDVLKGTGPGGCTDQISCRAYCNDITHIQACASFVDDHNLLSEEERQQARRIAQALSSGTQLPGGCKDADSCEAYCSQAKNASSCLIFAEQAGIMNAEELAEAKRMLPLIEQGKTPGKCSDKSSCETYCDDRAHASECIAFAESTGMITKEEAELARKTGGKGPGGCMSEDSCEAYCNTESHYEECFAFAEKYNLIPPEALQEMKEGMAQLRANFQELPDDARECLLEELGDTALKKIQSGTLTPGQEMGKKIKSCIQESLDEIQEKTHEAMQQATPEVLSCLKEKLSADDFSALQSGSLTSPKAGGIMKSCFAKLQEEGAKKMKEGIASMTPEMKACAQKELGVEKLQKLERGEISPEDARLQDIFENCVQEGMETMKAQFEAKIQEIPEPTRSCLKAKIEELSKRAETDPSLRSEAAAQPYIQECLKSLPTPQTPSGSGSFPQKPQGPRNDDDDNTPSSMPNERDMCAQFQSAPSCSYVPPQFQDMCERCKGE